MAAPSRSPIVTQIVRTLPELSRELEQLWQSSKDFQRAISDNDVRVCVVSSRHELLYSSKSLLNNTDASLPPRPCFEALMQRGSPCPGCPLSWLSPERNQQLAVLHAKGWDESSEGWRKVRAFLLDRENGSDRAIALTIHTPLTNGDAQIELARQQQFLQDLLDALPVGVFAKDPHDRFRFRIWNKTLAELTGIPACEALGQTDYELAKHDEDVESFRKTDQLTMDQGETVVVDRERVETPNSHFIATTSKTPLFDDDGRPRALLGVIQDITEKVRSAEEQQCLQEQLNQTQKLESLGSLAGGIAHDFNNLLTGVIGNIELALSELPPHSTVRGFLRDGAAAATQAADLCRQMLIYSGRGRFHAEKLDLDSLILESRNLLSSSISGRAALKLELAHDLPLVKVDPTQIRQILLNLTVNASEALIEERGGAITIQSGWMDCDDEYLRTTFLKDNVPSGRYVFLEVSDCGVGMDTETKERIFDPFFSTKFTGRGLGMAAVLGIVRGHGGAIKVYSESSKGTTIKVLLPAVEAELRTDTPRPVGEWQAHGAVLVIDDDESIRGITQKMLERTGLDVLLAADGEAALDLYRRHAHEIRCVLLDYALTTMSSQITYRGIRKLSPSVKVILTSGFTESEAMSSFNGKGIAAFLPKPFSYQKLVETLHGVLGDAPPDPTDHRATKSLKPVSPEELND